MSPVRERTLRHLAQVMAMVAGGTIGASCATHGTPPVSAPGSEPVPPSDPVSEPLIPELGSTGPTEPRPADPPPVPPTFIPVPPSVVCDPMPPPMICPSDLSNLTAFEHIASRAGWHEGMLILTFQPRMPRSPFSFPVDPTVTGGTVVSTTRTGQQLALTVQPGTAPALQVSLPLICDDWSGKLTYEVTPGAPGSAASIQATGRF